jgi:hypothetical protein
VPGANQNQAWAVAIIGTGFVAALTYLGWRFIPGFGMAMNVTYLTSAVLGAIVMIGLGIWVFLVQDKRTEKPLLSNLLVGVTCLSVGLGLAYLAFDFWQEHQDRFMSLLDFWR